MKTNNEWKDIVRTAQEEFEQKAKQYGNSLTAYDTFSILTKVFIKLFRIYTIQKTGIYKVEGESIETEFPAIINYCIYGFASTLCKEDESDALPHLAQATETIYDVFTKKNHDYGEIWRELPISFMVQECIVKFKRMYAMYAKMKFEKDTTKLSQNFQEVFTDICNYSIFCSINIKNGMNPLV